VLEREGGRGTSRILLWWSKVGGFDESELRLGVNQIDWVSIFSKFGDGGSLGDRIYSNLVSNVTLQNTLALLAYSLP
jgi:hypothetical protein